MDKWTVKKYVKQNGKCPIDIWLKSKAVTAKDMAALDDVITMIEATSGEILPPEKVKKFRRGLYEVKVAAPGKALRPMAIKDGPTRSIILLNGIVKKNNIYPSGDIEAAVNLRTELEKGNGHVKDYWSED